MPLSNVVAYVNFDMVGRLRDNKLILQGIGSSPAWRKLIEKRNVAAGFNLTLQEDPYLPTDTTPFYPKNVPVIAFFTGSHEEYHRPADKPDTLNYEDSNASRSSRAAWSTTSRPAPSARLTRRSRSATVAVAGSSSAPTSARSPTTRKKWSA